MDAICYFYSLFHQKFPFLTPIDKQEMSNTITNRWVLSYHKTFMPSIVAMGCKAQRLESSEPEPEPQAQRLEGSEPEPEPEPLVCKKSLSLEARA